MNIKRPQTIEEYIELVDLRASIEYDGEFMEGVAGFVAELEKELKILFTSLKDESYYFSKDDLPFMSLVNSVNNMLLPFKHILRQINDTHTRGLESA